MTKLRTASTNPTRTIVNCCRWKWGSSCCFSIYIFLLARTTTTRRSPHSALTKCWRQSSRSRSTSPSRSLTFWESRKLTTSTFSSSALFWNGGHNKFYLILIHIGDVFCLQGMTSGSNTWTWRTQDPRTLFPLKMCTGSGSLSLSLTTPRRMRRQRCSPSSS